MPISFSNLVPGEVYDRPELAELWGYEDWHAIGRGIVTPARQKYIILFVTREKQAALTQYQDHFEGDLLYMEGETSHANDDRLVQAKDAGDEIHLFYRDRHHSPFTYVGEVHLDEYEIRVEKPSRFVFTTRRHEAAAIGALATEARTHGSGSDEFTPDPEGQKRIRQHVSYERSPRNRARAIEIHGAICTVCGFDFNEFYGADLARDYVEVHHTLPVSEVNGGVVNPETDLVPVCSNCHSMAHRERSRIVPIDELRALVRNQRLAAAALAEIPR